MIRWMPCRSMSDIVCTWTPVSLSRCFSPSSRLRIPTSATLAGSTFGNFPPMPVSCRRAVAEQRGHRHAVDVAGGRRVGRVDVAVRVHPEEARPLLPAPGRRRRCPTRCRRRSSGRRRAPAGSGPRLMICSTFRQATRGGADDLGQVARAHVADLELLHVLDADVAVVHHRVAQLAQPVFDARDADGGRSHVHAAPAGAEVHRHAQHVDDHEPSRRSRIS